MSSQDIRWKQRFRNFENSLHFLEDGLKITEPTLLEKAGLIQFFEVCFELSWNLLKDFLEEQGFSELKYPRESIKKAFETGLITNGATWLEGLNNRNMMSHTYDEAMADRVVSEIRDTYYPILNDLFNRLKTEL